MFSLLPLRFLDDNTNIEVSLERLVQNFFGGIFTAGLKLSEMFRTVVKETDDAFIILADLPGVNRSDIKVGYKNNYFTISVIKRGGAEQSGNNFRLVQSSCGKTSRSFYMENINIKMMKVGFKKDILIIKLPKKGKIIEVKDRIMIK